MNRRSFFRLLGAAVVTAAARVYAPSALAEPARLTLLEWAQLQRPESLTGLADLLRPNPILAEVAFVPVAAPGYRYPGARTPLPPAE